MENKLESKVIYPWILVVLLCVAVIYAYERSPRVIARDASTSELILPDGARYSGDLEDGLMHGKGELVTPDGGRYIGDFEQGAFHGAGTYESATGERYVGEFEKGEFTGEGEYWGGDGEHYQGTFENWQYHGQGVLRNSTGVHTGEFKYGYPDGDGEFQHADSEHIEKGKFVWGTFEDPDSDRQQKAQAQALEIAIYQQSALIDELTTSLLPSDPTQINLYFVGVGGYSRQDVFRKELEVIRAQMDEQFATRGRSFLLLNHQETLASWPLATSTSIELGLQAVARKMNPERDILFLYLTSHGSRQHEFSLVQEGLTLSDLSAKRLGEIVRGLPVKWKLIVVSACYSGGFIPHLEDPGTLVMTAARRDRRSFGCSDDSDMTYFARAFFVDALPTASSFEGAFEVAKSLIRQRERKTEKNVKHSLPQISMGEEIREHLPEFWRALGNPSLEDNRVANERGSDLSQ